ncbi:MAG TPA: hypothetical protein DDY98_08540 [Ruminococcaceae bacterium]|nr:hypothetical protein [Oscillospiraceae bacterium]
MADLVNTLEQWFKALTSYNITDFNGFVSAVLHVFGFEGNFEGFTSMASLADEWFNKFGPLAALYETFINNIDTNVFVKLVNEVLAFINK